jgi:predicted nucleic acid-binding protein
MPRANAYIPSEQTDLIATFVIERGFALLHGDRDFDPFEAHLGLRVAR